MSFLNKNNLFLLEELVKKNFSTRFKDSYLGILWSVISPLLTMIILTIVFSTLFDRSIEYYPVYLLSGRMIYRYFSGTCGSSMSVLRANTNILLQKNVPKYIFILATLISEFIDYLISVGLLFVVMIVIGAPFHYTIPLSIIPLISLIIMTTGVSLILSVFSVYYKDVLYLWKAFTQLLMYASALFYPVEIIPEPFHSIIILNPILWIIQQFRGFFVYGTFPDLLNVIDSYLISIILLIIGIIVFKKYEKRITMQF